MFLRLTHISKQTFDASSCSISRWHVIILHKTRHISRVSVTWGGGLPCIGTFLGDFLVYKSVLRLELVSRSYKNIYRELRHSFIRFQNLVNTCWPFRQHMLTFSYQSSWNNAKINICQISEKVASSIYKGLQVIICHNIPLYCRKW